MIIWIILAVYAFGLVLSVKPLAEASLDETLARAEAERERDRHRYPNTWQSYHPKGNLVPTAHGRRSAAWSGLGKSLAWPVTMLVLLLARTIVSPTERARAAEAEVARMREFAKREGLEFPEFENGGSAR